MGYEDVEAELRRHPAVKECVVTWVPTGPGRELLVAYVVTFRPVDPAQVRASLWTPRLPADRVPRAVIPIDALPRTRRGKVDRDRIPLPAWVGEAAGGKASLGGLDDREYAAVAVGIAVVVAVAAYLFTDTLWPGSTDLSVVPTAIHRRLFTGLYVAECLSFGLGVSFLFCGYERLERLGRPRWLSILAHLSITWLLIAWWPQDNFYRLTAKDDWTSQAWLVYGFNITLMVAAAVLVAFVTHGYRTDLHEDQDD